jgi:two-component system LytT family response regulator
MIRALLVDDEAPARAKVRKLLAAEADVEVVGEAADGVEAVAAVGAVAPDVVFLDVQMPRLDGFGVIEEVGVEAMPLTVFVTAYDEHALLAFEVHALDYLLKPFAASRLRRVLERVRAELKRRAPSDLARRMERMLEDLSAERRRVRRILAKRSEGREALLAVERIDVIRADGNYLRLSTAEGEFTRRGTLAAFAGRLDPEQFLRINRSEVVRLDAVKELQPWFHGDYRVILKDGTTLTWSRRYRARGQDEID